MELPSYFLRRPAVETGPATIAGFERLYREHVVAGTGAEIPYDLDAPKWQFLCYLADHKNILMHGSGARDIAEFEPRKPNDATEFGNRLAVYAASDGLWPMYFAIVDRPKVKFLINASFRIVEAEGLKSEPYYYFAIDRDALPKFPWHDGMIYLLPGATFVPQPPEEFNDFRAEVAQWASPVGVKPLAKLVVTPDDFPFLKDVYGHDPDDNFEKAISDPKGFPWRDDPA